MIVPCDNIQSTFRRSFFASLGYETRRVRAEPLCKRDHLFRCGHLEIERNAALATQGRQALHVFIADMTTIFPEVSRDAISARVYGQLRSFDRVGMVSAAGVAQRCDVIDIDAKA